MTFIRYWGHLYGLFAIHICFGDDIRVLYYLINPKSKRIKNYSQIPRVENCSSRKNKKKHYNHVIQYFYKVLYCQNYSKSLWSMSKSIRENFNEFLFPAVVFHEKFVFLMEKQTISGTFTLLLMSFSYLLLKVFSYTKVMFKELSRTRLHVIPKKISNWGSNQLSKRLSWTCPLLLKIFQTSYDKHTSPDQ